MRGRTDWARTIQRDLPLSFDPGPVYYRPQQRFLVADVEHPITRVHAATLWRAARELGLWSPLVSGDAWLASLTADEAEMTIRRWSGRIYRDRDQRVCRWSETFWSSRRHVPASVATRPELWDVTDKFETVWEATRRSVLTGRESEVGDWMPGGRYVPLSGFNLDDAGLDLRQDIILRDRGHNVLLVLDAKFYTEGYTPKTQDILKQLAYA